ncbi:isoprenoid synthase domain-containing protein [Crassisporium funariophilum]|nr:isoprenoid synthase domain-containing protein [Crassisporium funariophilum]
MSLSQSFQLPDLISIVGLLELRTNRHCRFATDTSERWFSEVSGGEILTENELSYLHTTKIGLLAALCFPTCDAPQLRLLTDFLTLLFYSNKRSSEYSGKAVAALWSFQDLGSTEHLPSSRKSGMDMLKRHELLKHIIEPRISRLISKATDGWETRFTHSVQAYRVAQEHVSNAHADGLVPATLEEYVGFRRELNGISMVLGLAELLEIFQFPVLQGPASEKLEVLKHSAFDVINWSMDVVSYQYDQSRGMENNLVTFLMAHKSLSVQGAVNVSGNMIKTAFASFCGAEQALLEILSSNDSLGIPVLSWVWSSFAPGTSPDPVREKVLDDTRSYVTALKDCVIGTINWAYETELYFGKKGGEMRTFGWVFINSAATEDGSI